MAINSKKQKSEPADRQQSETPRQARAESKERKVTGKEEWKKPELESRGRQAVTWARFFGVAVVDVRVRLKGISSRILSRLVGPGFFIKLKSGIDVVN